jgi:hypothetical protein
MVKYKRLLLSFTQGLTIVSISAQLELFCPPYYPSQLMYVS